MTVGIMNANLMENTEDDYSIIDSTPGKDFILDSISQEYKTISEMSVRDRYFLNSVCLRKQPKKLLEIGVSSGGSSIILLNAIKNIEGAHLYSLDYSEDLYSNKENRLFCRQLS